MTDIVLQSLTERNFKGIRNFTLNTNGEDASVYGDNATGKTSQSDAFRWLLFGKDSQNKSDFAIKPLDSKGDPAHNVETDVEGVLMVDGRRRTLRRVFKEIWTKKRGSDTAIFDGNTTDYFVDGVPMQKKEYEKEIASLIDEDIFKLLTSPDYFNNLDKVKKRNTLLQICGNLTDDEVISSNPELHKLPAILDGRELEKHVAIIKARRTLINKELQELPTRINEATRAMPDVGELNEEFLIDDITSLRARVVEKESEMSRIQTGGEIAVKEKRQRELEGELIQLKNNLQSGTMDKLSAKRDYINSLLSLQGVMQRSLIDNRHIVEMNTKAIERGVNERTKLRKEITDVNAEEFAAHHDENCPSCGQSLPEDQVQAAQDKALKAFNLSKSDRAEAIARKGIAAKAECDRLEQENIRITGIIDGLEKQLSDKRLEVSNAESELNMLQEGMTDVSADPDYIGKQLAIDELKKEITTLRSSNLGAVEAARADLIKLRANISGLEQQQSRFAQVKVLQERIAELTDQEKALAAEYAKLEEEMNLSDKFTRTKVSLLESRINSKFRFARFKLFHEQQNGGLQDVCETTYEGVPYSTGLNNAAQINVGLDIINTLSEHYGFTAPIFIDNAEAVTRLIDTAGQKISLIVSEQDKQLRVENNDMKAAV